MDSETKLKERETIPDLIFHCETRKTCGNFLNRHFVSDPLHPEPQANEIEDQTSKVKCKVIHNPFRSLDKEESMACQITSPFNEKIHFNYFFKKPLLNG